MDPFSDRFQIKHTRKTYPVRRLTCAARRREFQADMLLATVQSKKGTAMSKTMLLSRSWILPVTMALVLSSAWVVMGEGAAPATAGRGVKPASRPAEDDYLVGVDYFCGWWREQPNKYAPHGIDWRTQYPGRVPLLGEYNEQATMDAEIKAAAEHGVDFFQILWYPLTGGKVHERHQDKLNVAVDQFMASSNAGLMKFTIEFCNHPPFVVDTDKDWDEACRFLSRVMKHPSYLRVSGRCVIKIHSLHHFLQQNGMDQQRVDTRIRRLRESARDSGAGELVISAGVMAGSLPPPPAAAPFDFLTTYMDMPQVAPREKPYPYEQLLAFAEQAWQRYAEAAPKPYVPYVPAGWDPRPWKDPRPPFDLPDRTQWLDALRRVKASLDRYPRLGIPSTDGPPAKAIHIYAWNEFAEGGFVAPTRGEGTMKLEVIREVFAVK